jgi:hypothetical protein
MVLALRLIRKQPIEMAATCRSAAESARDAAFPRAARGRFRKGGHSRRKAAVMVLALPLIRKQPIDMAATCRSAAESARDAAFPRAQRGAVPARAAIPAERRP